MPAAERQSCKSRIRSNERADRAAGNGSAGADPRPRGSAHEAHRASRLCPRRFRKRAALRRRVRGWYEAQGAATQERAARAMVVRLRARGRRGLRAHPRPARRRHALEWIEGCSHRLARSDRLHVLRRLRTDAGAPPTCPVAPLPNGTPASPEALFAKLERDTDLVLSAKLLDPELARRALADADANRPGEPTLGIIHKDFCAENIVLAPDGALVCVDDATLSTGPHDLDPGENWVSMADAGRGEGALTSNGAIRRSAPRGILGISLLGNRVLVGRGHAVPLPRGSPLATDNDAAALRAGLIGRGRGQTIDEARPCDSRTAACSESPRRADLGLSGFSMWLP